ncbi:MAG: arginase family protein [Candidatus Aenigmarchaeota archaeon]|nr:arginase family protein [Candidatus Aenigmarchaeota archaeon]
MPDLKGVLTDGKIFGTFLDNENNPSLAAADAGIFGVAFDATASYKKGTRLGPHAIMQASHQIEYPPVGYTARLSDKAKAHFAGIFEYPEVAEHEDVDALSKAMVADVAGLATDILKQQKLLALFGGEHSVLNGALQAVKGMYKPKAVTLLQIDAHLDLRDAFEGLQYSHGSIMRNAVELGFPTVQLGIRDHISAADVGGEAEYIAEKGLANSIFYCATQPAGFYARPGFKPKWIEKSNLIFNGMLDDNLARRIADLVDTEYLWITIDVDGFDPSIFPGTGTPLPHGLQLSGVERLLYSIISAGKAKLLGFDIVEVAPEMRTAARSYSPQEAVNTTTEMNAALLAYKLLFWNFLDRF